MTKPLLLCLSIAVALVALPGDARACGGCFPPIVTGSPSTVNAHRMAVALGTTQTTLWDQIQYTGSPSEFAWVLPVAAGVTVEVADARFFDSLEQLTKVQLSATLRPTTCPDACSFSLGGSGTARMTTDAGSPVTVLHEGVVGPYETATIASPDPMALVDWLIAHGYGVPTSITPTIQYYVEQHMEFVALRLRPGASVQQMQPVRVTTPGLSVTFPLRMVAAGVQDSVSLELYVFGEGRYETQNFPSEEVNRDAITYDYATSAFSYDDEFQAAIDRGEGRGWVAEYAEPLVSLPFVADATSGMGGSPTDELVVIRESFAAGVTPFLTKLRTNLPARFLDRDVALQASAGGEIDTFINVTRFLHAPPPCPTTCLAHDGTTAGLPGGDGTTTFSSGRCTVATVAPGTTRSALLPGLALFALAAVVYGRRRRRS